MPNQNLTGYPSIDKPWLRYYSGEAISAKLPKCSMFEFAYENNKNYRDDICFEFYGNKIKHGEFFDKIIKATKAFKQMGINEGDIVTIMSMHTPETLISIYALNYIGAVANMIYMTLSEKEIINYINNTDSKAFLILDIAIDKALAIKDSISVPIILLSMSDSMSPIVKLLYSLKKKTPDNPFIKFNDFIKNQSAYKEFEPSSNSDATAIIVYTSGTTGSPKGVMLSNECINAIPFSCALTDKNYKRKQTFLQPIPPFLGFGITMSHLGISLGQVTQLVLSPDPDEIAKSFIKLKSNRMVYGPRLTTSIIKYVKGDLSHLIDFTGGGEAIAIDKEKEINEFLEKRNANAKYTTGYGMTESASAITMNTNNIYKIGSVGIPLPTANVKVVDEGKELKITEIGELLFSGPSIMQGYYKNSDATNASIEYDSNGVRWLHTGDLGFVDEDGFVFITGRLKRIFTVFGSDKCMYKLFPQRIEEFVASLPSVKSCAVIVKKDAAKLHKAIAFVEFSNDIKDIDPEIDSINKALLGELPEHMQPEKIIPISSMPLTTSGKVDYRKLEEMAKEQG